MKAIALNTLGALDVAEHSCMPPLPTILALRDARIYIGFLNSCDKLPYVEIPVDKTFNLNTVLIIPNVNSND